MVPTRMDLGGKYAKRNQQLRKKIADDVLEAKLKKMRDRGSHLQYRPSEMQTQTLNSKRVWNKKQTNGRVRDELEGQY